MVCACDQNTLQEDSILVSLKTKGQGQLVMSWTVSYRALWTPLVCPYGQTSIYRPPPTRPLQRVMKETENEEPNWIWGMVSTQQLNLVDWWKKEGAVMCATVSGAGRGRYAIALPSPPTTSLIAIAPTVSPYNAPPSRSCFASWTFVPALFVQEGRRPLCKPPTFNRAGSEAQCSVA